MFAPALLPNTSFAAEEKIEFPQASQHAVVKQRVGLTEIEIDYSRPNKNNRQIFGGLVPFDKIWRTGANESTRIKFSDAVKFGEKDVPASEYALYTIPGANEWTVVLSKNTRLWGASGYSADADFTRVVVKPATLPTPVETFTIGFQDLKTGSATLALDWDTTHVPIQLITNTVQKLSAQIDAAIKDGKEREAAFYYSAASFYFDQNKDLAQAAKWIEQAVQKNSTAYFMFYKKAQIQAKLGNKPEATAAAQKSIELLEARPERDEAAIRNSRQLIESLR